MNIYELTPKNTDDPQWQGSVYKDKVVIRASSQLRAQQIANLALRKATARLPDGTVSAKPWLEDHLVECTVHESGQDNSEEAILDPEYFDSEWPKKEKNII